MVTTVIWLVAVALEVTILLRGLISRSLRHYPFFYSYLGYVLAQEFLRIIVFSKYPSLYPEVYWSTQFGGLVFGCGVVWEIYRVALAPFPGAQRVARFAFGAVGLVLLLKAAAGIGHSRLNWAVSTTVDLERDLRLVQAIALSALVLVFVFYGLSLGRNLVGLIVGYGLFVASSVTNLAIRARLGDEFQLWWQYLQPSLYAVVLLIWSISLWNYSVVARPSDVLKQSEDYSRLVNSTRTRLGDLRSQVNRGIKT